MDIDFVIKTYKLTELNRCKSVGLFHVNYDFAGLQKKIDKLLTVWRIRTYDFMRKGVFEHNLVRVQYLRNCIPSLGYYGSELNGIRYCRFYSCPWCWNRRYCGNLFKKLLDHKRKYSETKFYYFKFEKEYLKNQYKHSIKLIKEKCQEIIELNRKLTRRVSVLGGVSMVYLEPKQNGFKIVAKLLVSSKKLIELDSSFSPMMVSSNCSKIVVRFGSYPFAMLNRKNMTKGFAFFVKNINKKIRRTGCYGKLYKRRKH